MGPVSASAVKQIAGRAGRARSEWGEGFATTMNDDQLPYLHSCLSSVSELIPRAIVFPNEHQIMAFAAQMPVGTPLSTLMSEFVNFSQVRCEKKKVCVRDEG